jgi:hypothetical protein
MPINERPEFPKGTLDMLILKIVGLGPLHGHAISLPLFLASPTDSCSGVLVTFSVFRRKWIT